MSRSYYKKSDPGAGVVIAGCLIVIAFIIAAYAVAVAITMAVWNWALVPLLDWKPLDWPQALLIYLGIWLVGGAFRTITSK